MYYLNYIETDLSFIYKSNLRLIILKQNYFVKNCFILELPNIEINCIFNKIIELNILKLFNYIVLLWFLTNNKTYIKKLKSRLERGIKYFNFIINNKVKYSEYLFKIFDFIANKIFFLIEKKYLNFFLLNNYFFLIISNLEIFSNIRLSKNFFTSKINNNIYIKFFFKSKKLNLKISYLLNLFKIFINE